MTLDHSFWLNAEKSGWFFTYLEPTYWIGKVFMFLSLKKLETSPASRLYHMTEHMDNSPNTCLA